MSGDLEGARSQLSEASTLAQGLDDPGVDAMLALAEGFIALAEADVETLGRVYAEWAPGLGSRRGSQTLSYLLSLRFLPSSDRSGGPGGPLLQESLGIERRLEIRRLTSTFSMDWPVMRRSWAGLQTGLHGCLAPRNLHTRPGFAYAHMEPVLAHARSTIAASLGIPAQSSETQVESGCRRMKRSPSLSCEETNPAPHPHVDAKEVTPLSKRELEVARLVADGMSNKEIASRAFSPSEPWRRTCRTSSISSASTPGQRSAGWVGASWVRTGALPASWRCPDAVRPQSHRRTRTEGSSAMPKSLVRYIPGTPPRPRMRAGHHRGCDTALETSGRNCCLGHAGTLHSGCC